MATKTLTRVSPDTDHFTAKDRQTGGFAGIEDRELAELKQHSHQVIDRAEELRHIDDLFVRYSSSLSSELRCGA